MSIELNRSILIDMDGVFADFVEGFYRLAKFKYPDVYEALPAPDSLTDFYIENSIKDPELKEASKLIACDPSLFYLIPPMKDAINGMKKLKEEAAKHNIKIFICTAPHKENKDSYKSKAEWIDSYLGREWLDQLIITRDKSIINAAVLVDDKPDPLGQCIPTWKHVLFRQSYNESITDKPFMKDWSDESILSLILYTLTIIERQHLK